MARVAVAALMLSLVACSGHKSALKQSPPPSSHGGSELLGDAYYHFLRALDAENVGDLDEALSHFRQALIFDPDSHQIMTRIARVLERLGQRDEALAMAQRALVLNPDYVPAMLQLARMYAHGGRFNEAKAIYQKALTIESTQGQIYLELARLYRREGALQDALDVLGAYSTQNPRTSVSHMALEATVLREMERPEEAEAVYLDLLSTYPWVVQPRRELIGLFMLEGGTEYAAGRLEQLYEDEPWQDWIPSALVDLYIQLENIPALMAQLDELEARSEDNRDLRLNAVEALLRNRAFDAAEAVLQPALSWGGLNGDDARYLYAQIAFNQDRYEEAAQRFGAIDEGSEAYVDALIRRAFSLEQIGEMDVAVVEVEAYLEQHPDDSAVRFALGVIFEEAKRYPEAVAAFDALLAKDPDHVDTIGQRAVALDAMGQRDEAVASLSEAIERLPGHVALYEILASLYADGQQFDEAIGVLQKALRANPDDFGLRFQLASTLDLAGKKQDAIAQMKLLLERYPDNPDILNFIGYTYAELGVELAEAEMMILKALEQEPDNGFILDSLGWVFFKQAEYTKAADTLERAVSLSDREPIIVEHLGDAYAKLSRPAEALALYEYALSKFSEDPDANPSDVERISIKVQAFIDEGVSAQPPAIFAAEPQEPAHE